MHGQSQGQKSGKNWVNQLTSLCHWTLILTFSHLSVGLVVYIHFQDDFEKNIVAHLNALTEEVSLNTVLREGKEVKINIIKTILEKTRDSKAPQMSMEQISQIADLMLDAHKVYGIKPSMVLAIMEVESSFNYRAVSNAGAKGLMQVMDGTARPYLDNYEIVWHKDVLFDPVLNVKIAIDYLITLHEENVARGREQENTFTVTQAEYYMSTKALTRLLNDELGLAYPQRINKKQSEIRKAGIT